MFNADTTQQQNGFFDRNPLGLRICLLAMFLLAALIRRDDIKAPGHLIEREYNSAVFARAFYFQSNVSIEPWRRDIALAARDQLPLLEPPLTEYFVSLVYRVIGREEIWYARYLTGFFWLVGGIFMYRIARSLLSVDAALIAVGYYLFVPMGIIISRSFQPDSLMMMMFLISLYSIIKYFKRPSWHLLLLAGSVTGITLLIRPLVLFGLFCAFIALSIYKKEPGRTFINRRFLVFFALSLLPPLVFYGYGLYIAKFLQSQAELSFRPYLLPRWEFWLGWFHNGADTLEHVALFSALFGFFLLKKNSASALVIGLIIGYLIFGMVFTYHVHTHPYYHIQLFPVIGICAAVFLITMSETVRKLTGGNWWIPVTLSVICALYLNYSDVKSKLYNAVYEDPNLDREVGELVHHSPHTVFVAYHYGLPLEYYGEFSGSPWPVKIDDPFYRRPDARELSVEERLDALGFVPDYFIITNFELYHRKHQDLKTYLEANCSIAAQTDQYLVYGSCKSATLSSADRLPIP